MAINYLTLCTKVQEVDGKQMNAVRHVCVWEENPTDTDIDNLVKELWKNESFGLAGDDDYQMFTVHKDEQPELFKMFNISTEETPVVEEKPKATKKATTKKATTKKATTKKATTKKKVEETKEELVEQKVEEVVEPVSQIVNKRIRREE